jgi:hypothetical protein
MLNKFAVSNEWVLERARRGAAARLRAMGVTGDALSYPEDFFGPTYARVSAHGAEVGMPDLYLPHNRRAERLQERWRHLRGGVELGAHDEWVRQQAAGATPPPSVAAAPVTPPTPPPVPASQGAAPYAAAALGGTALLGTGAYLATRPNEKTAAYLAGYSSILAVFS